MTEEKKSDSKENKNEHKHEKKQDNILYWSIALLITIILLLFAGAKFFSDDTPEYETMTYNNWEFTKIAGMWWFEWQKDDTVYQVPLRFNPLDAKGIPVVGKINTTKFNAEDYVYITFDLSNDSNQQFPILALAATELTQNIASAIKRTPIASCTNNNSEACIERTIKNCKNTDEPVILLHEGGQSGVLLADNCIILQGDGIELVKAVDRLLYHWYGIIS